MVLGWGKKMVTKKDDTDEMSMEEILASIRKYVTDEPISQPTSQRPPNESHDPDSVIIPPKNGSAGVVKTSPSPTSTEPTHHHEEAPHRHPHHPPEHSQTVLDLTDPLPEAPSHSQEKLVPSPQPTAVSSEPYSQNQYEERTQPLMTRPEKSSLPEEPLVSEETVSASASAFSKLMEAATLKQTPTSSVSSGVTLDQLIKDLAKPMIKEWLDKNLAPIVETMVAKEIEKITKKLIG
jgi:cell pole-organizing protein PopZ